MVGPTGGSDARSSMVEPKIVSIVFPIPMPVNTSASVYLLLCCFVNRHAQSSLEFTPHNSHKAKYKPVLGIDTQPFSLLRRASKPGSSSLLVGELDGRARSATRSAA
jgi:hypothetical protein